MLCKWVVLASALIATAAAAREGDRRKVQYDCDSASGRLSSIAIPHSAEHHLVTGRLRADGLYRHKRFAPTSQIWISDGLRWAGIELVSAIPKRAVETKEGSIAIVMRSGVKGTRPQEERVGSTKVGEEVTFSIAIVANTLTLEVAGTSRKLELNLLPDQTVELACSSGDFKFIDIAAQ